MEIMKTLAAELGLKESQVEATVALLDEGSTIPFIARYRKEVTGGLDDEQLEDFRKGLHISVRSMRGARKCAG